MIKHDTVIFGRTSLEDATAEARLVGGDVRIAKVVGASLSSFNTDTSPSAYVILPSGQKCPCCGGTI